MAKRKEAAAPVPIEATEAQTENAEVVLSAPEQVICMVLMELWEEVPLGEIREQVQAWMAHQPDQAATLRRVDFLMGRLNSFAKDYQTMFQQVPTA